MIIVSTGTTSVILVFAIILVVVSSVTVITCIIGILIVSRLPCSWQQYVPCTNLESKRKS